MADYLVVGLGNIGAEYASTRHNMGFMILDAWAQASNVVFSVERYGAVAEISFKGRHFTLLKPSTYMNLSGNAVRYWLQKLNLPLENLIVISDDLNLPFGTLRMRLNGSDGGHNGLENIIWTLESDQRARIRVGIGNRIRADSGHCGPDHPRNQGFFHDRAHARDEFCQREAETGRKTR